LRACQWYAEKQITVIDLDGNPHPLCFQNTEPLQCRDDVAYMYYRSLKTLKAPADLIKFLGSLTGDMPENAEPPSGNEWCKETI